MKITTAAQIMKDTMQRNGVWSHTLITKFVILFVMINASIYDVLKKGYLDNVLLVTWLGYITGDRYMKKEEKKLDMPPGGQTPSL